jgi:peptidoglycan/LPS O-acetylase OafA/YrhL
MEKEALDLSQSVDRRPSDMSDSRGRSVSYIPTLDGWRAIAILLVMLSHLGTAFYSQATEYWSHSPARFGVIGVPIFFGISGFLITALLLKEFQTRHRISLKAFYIRRCFRILPPLFVYVLVVGALGLIATRAELVASFLFFRNYLPDRLADVYTAHLWSLSIEEHFYLLWPITLCALLRLRKLLLPTAAIALILGIWGVIDLHLGLLHRIAPVLDTPTRTDLRLAGLVWGCAAGIIFQNARMRQTAVQYLRLPVFIAAFLLLAGSQVITIHLASIWAPALIPILILGTVIQSKWKLSAILEWPALRWIGRISYSLYLWQQLFLVPKWHGHPFPLVQTLPLSLLLPFACAAASHVWIEQPAIRLGRRLAQRVTIKPLAIVAQTGGTVEAA